jgi:uncharacterized protein (PEP-CTERM system associated)
MGAPGSTFDNKNIGEGQIPARVRILALLVLNGLIASAVAQEESTGAAKRAWSIVPGVSIKETFTDNANISGTNKESDWITEIAPGVRINGQTARVKLFADYRFRNLVYASGSRSNQVQHSLSSYGKLEALDDLLFVDVNGSISRQQISAFGSQSAANYSVNSNSTENRTFRVSPYVKGRFAGLANYELRYSDTRSRSDSAGASEVNSAVWSGRVSGSTPFAALGWSIDADDQRNEYVDRRTNNSEHWRGMLTYRILPQFSLSASAGQERNDYLTAEMTAYSTHGFGFDWRPTERTQVSAFKEKRFFGDGHTVTLSHRLPRSAVKYTDSRDVSILPPQSLTVGLGTYFDLFSSLFASAFPDEVARAIVVNGFLAAYGLSPDAVITTDFINAQASVRRRQELSYVIQGARNVVTFSLVRGFDEKVGTAILVGINDFSTTSAVRQQGVTAAWAHKLSALSSLSVNAGYSRNRSAGDVDLRTTQKSFSAAVTTSLGAKTRGSVTARRTESSGSAAPYTENSVAGAVTVEF